MTEPCAGCKRPLLEVQPGNGLVGTELHSMLALLGIYTSETCDCETFANQMDAWGVDGCQEHKPEILAWLEAARTKSTWLQNLSAAVNAIKTGVAAKINPLDPIPGLVNEAIRRAARKIGRPDPNLKRPPPIRPNGARRFRKSASNRRKLLSEATVRQLAADSTPTPPAILQFRDEVCSGCPLNVNRECGACGSPLDPIGVNPGKLRRRSETCHAGRWTRHTDTLRPLVNPTRNLIFHVYPLKGAEWNWHWHLEQIARYAEAFNGKICIGIGTGQNLASPDVVQSRLAGVPVSDWVIQPNNKQLAETSTFVELLKCVKTDDPNTITFRFHTKGVTHRKDGVEQPWARLLWETNMDIASVEDALASHTVAGAMLSHEPLVRRHSGGDFFFAGSAYWFRSDVFQRDWAHCEPNRWWVEYWPGAVAKQHEAACLCHDFTDGAVLSMDYFDSEVRKDWNLWRIARGLPDA